MSASFLLQPITKFSCHFIVHSYIEANYPFVDIEVLGNLAIYLYLYLDFQHCLVSV